MYSFLFVFEQSNHSDGCAYAVDAIVNTDDITSAAVKVRTFAWVIGC